MKQEQALEILKSGKNAFITGPAGSGKTYVLNLYIDWLKANGVNAAITASTGVAATHLNGITIHSWTGLGVRDELTTRDVKELVKRSYLRRRFLRTSILIIDEISMLASPQLDMADQLFRAFKQIDAPFGGVQVVLCGDFFQLPPIQQRSFKSENHSKKNKSQMSLDFNEDDEMVSKFAYGSRSWRDLDLKICYLDEQHRQSDKDFLTALNAIRSNSAGENIRKYLQTRVGAKIQMSVEPTKLYTHNVAVEAENNLELAKISGKEFCYNMEHIGPAALVERLQKGCLAPQILRLKVGARVMFVKNNFEEGYVNGTMGVVEKLDENGIMVRTATGILMIVGLASWHIAEDGKVLAQINQYPLRLAWAITVHKSQGMSLDAALVDLRQSFEAGMGYVALSRVRSSLGLSLVGFNEIALRVDQEVLAFDEKLKSDSVRHTKEILANPPKPRRMEIVSKRCIKPDTIVTTQGLLESGKTLGEIAEIRKLKISTIIDHCETIKQKNPAIDFSGLAKDILVDKIIEIKTALKKCQNEDGHYPLKPVKELLGDNVSYDEICIVRLLL